MAMKRRFRLLLSMGLLATSLIAGLYLVLRLSLPKFDGVQQLAGLGAPAEVSLDKLGIPKISAENREDAFRVLGFVTCGERLFQMDLSRRQMAGRLAEVMGAGLKKSDIRHRVMGFEQVAKNILQRLPEDEKRVLEAYAQGVNQAMNAMQVLPPEFLLLRYRPAVWRPEDSLLVVLGMEETLGWTGEAERMDTTMKAALPPAVYDFFTPPMDHYTDQILNGLSAQNRPVPLPKDDLAALLQHGAGNEQYSGISDYGAPSGGSNAWVVGPQKTWNGRTILANDMHMKLRMPNIWYRAEISYGDVRLTGLTLPGVPLLAVGSNGRVAWGLTSIQGDFVDLVSVNVDPGDPQRYHTPQGPAKFGERAETMQVRGESDQTINVRTTIWGPVLPDSLLGKPVAVRWTALDPAATDLQMLDLDKAMDVTSALNLFNRAGSPPLNALVADSNGNIGWTITGKIPKRFGLDGAVSASWADGMRGWDGYVPPDELPRTQNPPSGFIVNANQRMVDYRYPYVIGHYFDNGYRAYRIGERLSQAKEITERDLLDLQLDTRTEFYRFYQQLALSVLDNGDRESDAQLRSSLERWDGFAERDSTGLAIVVEFRRMLIDTVISPFLGKCRSLDPAFRFSRATVDGPLQRLLEAKLPELQPEKTNYKDWNSFLYDVLKRAERNVDEQSQAKTQLPPDWGQNNQVSMMHPLSSSLPLLKYWLDMPKQALPGCAQCIRWYAHGNGASERLIVSPGQENLGILHMPGGQSGHPLSPHYGDQHQAWIEGRPLPLLSGQSVYRLAFQPSATAGTP
ncbi:penicillin acylase family protein [Candidatus Methylospira mobilis]|uniref:Penicillin acylase family protein n=1 Tax=Candidatus Methylospira mobilis TaxID=1808979 RepID=A0A5Q0BR63_9GAMM|nr:penicillin acylase family protein [Candidatus Methylospira mobilis]QFY44568.1 penicillin acylase family protein [Candidatus Methylospira mobilis]